MAAGFGAQANALLRKSATYQKRNVGTNICLLSSPIFFCIILLIIKLLVNNLFLTGEDFECGCRCTQCCKNGKCKNLQQGFCNTDSGWECKQYDKSQCGLPFSSPQQASWCEVPNPSIWPAITQVPKPPYVAKPNRPNITSLLSPPQQSPAFTASQLGTNLLTSVLPMDNVTLLALIPQLVAPDGTVDATFFSQYGYAFGTTKDGGVNQYIELGFVEQGGDDYLYLLVPANGSTGCADYLDAWNYDLTTGLLYNASTYDFIPDNTVFGQPLISVVAGMVYMSTSTVVTWSQINAELGGRPILAGFLNTTLYCANVDVTPTASPGALDQTVYCGYRQARCNGSVTINEYAPSFAYEAANPSSVSFSVVRNDTGADNGGGPDSYQRLPAVLSNGVAAWFSNVLTGTDGIRVLGTSDMPKQATKLKLDLSSLLGPLFYTWVVQMLLPTFLQLLVYEKEKRLRMMMKMHGLGDGAYWLVTYLWYLLLYIVYMIIFVIFGAGVGLESFRRTSMGIQVIFYFLFGNNMIAMAFMLSSFFSSSRTSTVVAFIYVFATGLLGELLFKTFMETNASWIFFVEWIPAFALYRGLWEQAQYALLAVYQNESGLTFEKLGDKGCGMAATWGIFAVEWVIFMVLGWYFEQVLSTGTGIRRHPLYFLDCCRPRRKTAFNTGSTARASIELTADAAAGPAGSKAAVGSGSGSLRLAPGEREDVRAERLRVENMDEATAAGMPILVKDLRKVYPPQDGGKPKVAVRTLTMAIERGECFGLLGPNGAGKSTSINMLTGFLEPTAGTALIEGNDITTQMDKIYRLMGVCPQHDLQWEQLTGEEHLYFYGRLKGLKGAELVSAVNTALKSVNLLNGGVGQKQSRQYSGGMRRRLSVAISFIGNPQVVYLDEPSTGLDPASRRNLWDVVRAHKDGRAIILTTHSMEEAEILCDRLGIFVDGQLVCIGNPREITSRYAGYLVFTITVAPGQEDVTQQFVQRMSPNCRLTYALGTTFKYELPTTDVSLSSVFDAMASVKSQLQVLDWGVANATLEEVFIKFARQIGAETKDG